MANRTVDGYPMPVGDKIMALIDHDGPASYNNTGTFATSGEIVNAIDLGMGGIDFIDSGDLTSDGVNTCEAQMVGQSTSADNHGNAVTTVRLHWFVQATGVEVANAVALNTKSIRLRVVGV